MSHLIEITAWVKAHTPAVIKDTPYMDLMAEWEDWSFIEPSSHRLSLGYFKRVEGETVFDPVVSISFEHGEVTHVTIGFFNGSHVEQDGIDQFVAEFIDTLWERHFEFRVDAAPPSTSSL